MRQLSLAWPLVDASSGRLRELRRQIMVTVNNLMVTIVIMVIMLRRHIMVMVNNIMVTGQPGSW